MFPGVRFGVYHCTVYAYSMDGGSSQMPFVTNFNQLQAETERATEQAFFSELNAPWRQGHD